MTTSSAPWRVQPVEIVRLVTGNAANFPGISTSALSQEQITYLPVINTAGASINPSPTSTSSSAQSERSPSSGGATSTKSESPLGSSSTASPTTSRISTGGVARETGSSKLVQAGAIAALVARLS